MQDIREKNEGANRVKDPRERTRERDIKNEGRERTREREREMKNEGRDRDG